MTLKDGIIFRVLLLREQIAGVYSDFCGVSR